MLGKPVNLLQKPDSPQHEAVSQLLVNLNARPNLRFAGGPLPAEALAAPSLWLWDIHGFCAKEVEDLGRDLQPDPLGVMILCGRADELAERAVRLSGAVELVVCPADPAALAAALTEADRAQSRIADLLAKRDQVRRDIADRMVVEDAKLLIMSEMDKSEPEAMRYLQNLSRRLNQKLAQTARMVLGNGRPERG